jgi:hypothetical protein
VSEYRFNAAVSVIPAASPTIDQAAKPDADSSPACDPDSHHLWYSEMWGILELPIYAAGSRMGPDGVPYNPLFGLNFDFNIGLLPHKELYLFADNQFWAQKPGAGITNPSQGQFDFSKREYDLDVGIAWNYWRTFEFRASAYSMNNLNRGVSLADPYGFQDGVGLENRYYFGDADIYDIGRLSFVSLGYYPTKSMVGGDGSTFKPGLFGEVYYTYDMPVILSYAYIDGKFTAEEGVNPRLLELDVGLAIRPFCRFENFEIRFGDDLTGDVRAGTARNLVYGSIRLAF